MYCKAAEAIGWSPELFDIDQKMLIFAHERLGIQKTWGNFEEVAKQTYELIFAFHVIEHWNEIDEPLLRLLSMLEPGGKLIFATPNARSVEKFARPIHHRNYFKKLSKLGVPETRIDKLLGMIDSVLCWDPPRHLFAFTPDSLQALGTRLGLQTVVFTGYNTDARYEPRRYVFPKLRSQLRTEWHRGGGKKCQIVRASKTFYRYLQMKFFQVVYPNGGEQLYVRYTKPTQ